MGNWAASPDGADKPEGNAAQEPKLFSRAMGAEP